MASKRYQLCQNISGNPLISKGYPNGISPITYMVLKGSDQMKDIFLVTHQFSRGYFFSTIIYNMSYQKHLNRLEHQSEYKIPIFLSPIDKPVPRQSLDICNYINNISRTIPKNHINTRYPNYPSHGHPNAV